MIKSEHTDHLHRWSLIFDPKEAGPERDQVHYELKPLSLTEMKKFALRASKIRANLLQRAADMENE